MSITKAKAQNVIKAGAQSTPATNYTNVQPGTVYEDDSIAVLKAQSGTIYPFTRPELTNGVAADGTFISRIGATPIFADGGGGGVVGVLSFKLWQFTQAGGRVAYQGVARISAGPDATLFAATKGTVAAFGALAAGGSGLLAEVETAADGEFTANITFNANGAKIVTISFGMESYFVTVVLP